jgi:2-keto-3-deoxy-6-phosphogluconate aldolase
VNELHDTRVIAILRLRDHGLAVEVGDALVRGGIRVLELTLDDPAALASLRAVAVGLGSDLVGARPTDRDLAGIESRARVAIEAAA